MNIEQLLPELKFSSTTPTTTTTTTKNHNSSISSKIYTCQKCLNHNLSVARKNHKFRCPFLHCSCEKCQLVDRRRSLNAELAQVKAMEESMPLLSPIMMSGHDVNKERLPHCQRCAQHNLMNRLKGHKRYCPFRACTCAKCKVVAERQRLMADQIKLRRKQKKQKTINFFHGSSQNQQQQQRSQEIASLSPTPSHLSSSSTTTTTNENNRKASKICKNNKKINNESQSLLPSTFLPHQQQQLPPQFSHIPFPTFPMQPLDWRLAFAFCALKHQQQQQQQQHQIFPQHFSFFKNESTNSP